MGFSVEGEDEDFEYAGHARAASSASARTSRARRSGGCSPTCCASTARCARIAHGSARDDRSLAQFVEDGGYSRWFIERLIVPQVSAVWSADPAHAVGASRSRFLAEFFANHGMLGFRDRPRWQTVVGGSRSYVEALTRAVRRRASASPPPSQSVRRDDDGVDVRLRARRGRSASTRSSSPATPTRRSRCWRTRPRPSASCSAPSPTSTTRRRSTPTRRCSRAGAAARQAWNFHLFARAPPGADGHLLHEPPPASRARRRTSA